MVFDAVTLGLFLASAVRLAAPILLALVVWVLLGKSNAGPSEIGIPFLRGQK